MLVAKTATHRVNVLCVCLLTALIWMTFAARNVRSQQLAPLAEKGVNAAVAYSRDRSSDETAAAPPEAEDHQTPKGGRNKFLRFFGKTTVDAFVSTYYSHNYNHPVGEENLFRSFDTRDRRLSLEMAEASFEKESTADSRLSFRLDLFFGRQAVDFLNSEETRPHKATEHLHQAYVGYLVPLGKGLQVDVGKFIPWAGAEYDEAKEDWNYSRSLLYTLGQPTFHTGVRTKYKFSDKVALTGAVVNGWGNTRDNNGGKTFGVALDLEPADGLSLTQSYTVGPEQPDDSHHLRHLLDTVVSYEFNERIKVMGNYDYGHDTLTDGSSVRWQGVAAYLRVGITKELAFSPRFEIYDDPDGYTSGTAQRLKEVTLTGEYKFNKYVLTRLEYRRDWSNQPVFERTVLGGLTTTQSTLLGGVILSFSTRDKNSDDAGDP